MSFNQQARSAGKSFSSNKPAAAGAKKEMKPTTHYMVTGGEEKNFVQGTFLTETTHGGLTFVVKEAIQPGIYFINKKKDAQ